MPHRSAPTATASIFGRSGCFTRGRVRSPRDA
jgi:hypothetical protein